MSTILVIDDEEPFRRAAIDTLQKHGYQTLAAASGLQGIELAHLHHPDLILCDVSMNPVDGFSVVRNLQSTPDTALTPCILATGMGQRFDLRQGMELGADDFLLKPFTAHTLLSAIEARLRKQQLVNSQRDELVHRERTLLRTLIDHLPDMIYVKDLEGRKTLTNRADCENMGYHSENEALGKSDFNVYPAEIAAKFHADDQSVFQTGQPVVNSEEVFIDAQGRQRWLLTSKLPLHNERGQIIGLIGVSHDITGRRQMETASRESLRKYQDLVESISDWYWEINTDGRLVYSNPRIKDILGYDPGQVVGKAIFEIMPGAERARLGDALARAGQNQQRLLLFESLFLYKDGDTVLLETNASLVFDAAGRIQGYRGVSRDMTQRRRFEEKLHILSRAVEQSPASVVITDTDGHIEYVNPKFCALTGYTLEEVLGRNPSVLKSGETPPPEYTRLWATISGGGEWHGEFHNKKKNGELYWESAVVSPIKNEAGSIAHYLAVKEDITERKTAARELARAHHHNELILNSVEEGIVEMDPDGNHTFANQAALRMLGWEWADLMGKPSHALWHHTRADGRSYPREECQIYATLRDGRTRRAGDEVFWRRDGTSFPVEYVSTPIYDGEHSVGVAVSFHDITAREQAEQERQRIVIQLSQAQKLESIGQLAAGIAHEINTPIQYVGDNLRFLKDAFADMKTMTDVFTRVLKAAAQNEVTPELLHEARETAQSTDFEYLTQEVPKAVQQALEGVDRVAKIVRAMKEFSHPGSDEKTMVDLNHAIETTVTVARNEWKYVSEVTLDLDPKLPPVPCLPGEFNQAVLNLIVNAAHAIAAVAGSGEAAKGMITVTTRKDGDWVEIRIQDTGTGIPEKIRDRVFDPFFTTKPVGKGTGQGLAIARSVVVDKHGGTIKFETEAGRGTTFIIRLPMNSASAPAPEPKTSVGQGDNPLMRA